MADESHKQRRLAGTAAPDTTMDIDDEWLLVEDDAHPVTTSIIAPKGTAASALSEAPIPAQGAADMDLGIDDIPIDLTSESESDSPFGGAAPGTDSRTELDSWSELGTAPGQSHSTETGTRAELASRTELRADAEPRPADARRIPKPPPLPPRRAPSASTSSPPPLPQAVPSTVTSAAVVPNSSPPPLPIAVASTSPSSPPPLPTAVGSTVPSGSPPPFPTAVAVVPDSSPPPLATTLASGTPDASPPPLPTALTSTVPDGSPPPLPEADYAAAGDSAPPSLAQLLASTEADEAPPMFPSASFINAPPAGLNAERVSAVVARSALEGEPAAMADEAGAEIDSEWPEDDVPQAPPPKQAVVAPARKVPGPADLPGPLIPEVNVAEIQAALAIRRARE